MTDARFEDAEDGPLRLIAQNAEDLVILSGLVQDAVFASGEMAYARGRRRFAAYVNRFRWEDRAAAAREKRGFERVQALLVVENVLSVQSLGIDRGDAGAVLSLLSLRYAGPPEGPGRLVLVLAGGGEIALEVEALEVSLRDTTRPYYAVSGKVPGHG